ncbi:RhoGEF domain containing protein gxcH [Dissostichus eleginoides]|uniref:RhoGEF domain containing protein gxcH n=1 Tax=Dissostichus eleginoides TaxID=100907 RepID=A0AAD9CPH0_DISEL|nr:RhoGEF domain containing protein gxcH [Dissostichus eleginoides]
MSSSTRNKAPIKQDISKEKNDKQRRPASPASASLKTDSNTCDLDHEVTLLDELGKLLKENQEGHNQTKMSLDRLEQTVLDIKELHKKRAKVHEVIKQLKKKDILARCIYPAQLKLKLGKGEKTYTTLSSAAEVLKHLGVEVRCGERECTEDELKDGWRSSGKKKRDTVLSASDLRAFLQEEA